MAVRTSVRKAVTAVVTGRTEPRPRAVWRLLSPFALVVGLGTALTVAAMAVLPVGTRDGLGVGLLSDVLQALVVVGVLVVSARYVDRRELSAYGFRLSRTWWVDFGAGAVLGVVLVAATFASSYALGGVRVVDVVSAGDVGSFAAWFLLFGIGHACTAFWEETLFRGLLVTNASEGLAARGVSPRTALLGALLLSSLLFGVAHVPFSRFPGGTSPVGMLAVWTLMGGLLGLAYVVSGDLAFPIGLHLTANYAITNVFFGSDPTGFPAPPTIVRTEIIAPETWHPLGGLPMIGVILAGYALTLGWFFHRDDTVTLALHVAEWQADADSVTGRRRSRREP